MHRHTFCLQCLLDLLTIELRAEMLKCSFPASFGPCKFVYNAAGIRDEPRRRLCVHSVPLISTKTSRRVMPLTVRLAFHFRVRSLFRRLFKGCA